MHYSVLIVDDMPVNRKLMKKVLKNSVEEVTFYEAEDGFEALELLGKKEIDLIILDLMMPGKDGYQVLREIKGKEALKDIPVIVNSAVDDMGSFKETLTLGAIDYFTKPITPDQMKVIIPLKVHNALKFYEQKKELMKANEKMMQEMKIASVLQKALITGEQDLKKVRVKSKYIPSSQIGGDFHDCIETEDKVWFIIADVTGHGVAAAMVSSMVKVIFNHVIQESRSPKEVLEHINYTFYHMMSDNRHLCFSAFVGVIEKDRLTYANAGHPYAGLYQKNSGEVRSLEQNGFLIGVFEDTDYEDLTTAIEPGDFIIAYTDGLYETKMDEGESSNSHETVFEEMKKHKSLIPHRQEDFMKAMIHSFGKFEDGDFEDDVALMMIEVKS
ncbi:fused response regulator/phosphatase [Isachenkonia alkalipeptolytica]|uniref:Stage 0 sporulation protein A homolog n=1 Tax=Isachenkonia alkalipeptolytica TaxID=2565777 RepID=A0AA43XKA5_9CLOT|nr:fused response regulator/phosphatase [Isachenkonia alkalipeptolytica]NBG87440.1 fused response regulator/phosphatase [Isachenkonia alkalipeptolytica]